MSMSLLQWAHLLGFAFAFLGSFGALWRTRRLSHRGTRYGLYGLLVTSGLWAGSYIVTFLTSSRDIASAAYLVGLVCGITTVFAWLYFCSAYTGESYHHQPVYRYPAVGILLAIVAVKITNPIHGQYYTLELSASPFPHAEVTLLGIHGAVTVLAYALSAVGFYMLWQLFQGSRIKTTGLGVLVGLTALPALVNLPAAVADWGLVAANYEPIAVAIFALGTLYVAEDTFERVRWAGHKQVLDQIDEAVMLLDDDGVVYKHNTAAEQLFGSLEADRIDAVFSEAETIGDGESAPQWGSEGKLLTIDDEPETRYYLLRESELTLGPHSVGRAVVVNDVTQLERQRRQLKRQSDQLEGFGEAIAHELRNSLTIIDGNLQLVAESLDGDLSQRQADIIEAVLGASDRMAEVVSDLMTIGRLSRPVDEVQPLGFQSVVQEASDSTAEETLDIVVEGEGCLWAERTRLFELIDNVVRLAIATESTELAVRLTVDGFSIETDGQPVESRDTEALFEYGTAVPHADAGMLGPNIRSLAQAHGWSVTATPLSTGGLSITVSGVQVEADRVAESAD